MDEKRAQHSERSRIRVSAFAKSWIESKAVILDDATCDTYTEALEKHALPALGKFYYDALKPSDVQAWVNRSLQREGKRGKFSVSTVHRWYRVFRTMTRDAIAQLDLPRDPTMRVRFPDRPDPLDANALTPDELARFLGAMRTKYPRTYPLAATLAFTGLRFCHASALKWEDIDEKKGVIRIVRKNVHGVIGPVSKKKRAPKEMPLPKDLADILKKHRKRIVQKQEEGFEDGWVFPAGKDKLREPGSLRKAWLGSLKAAKIEKHFTVHGLRRTFNDLARRAGVDAVITRSITGHVTEQMREHYSTVGLDEKKAAVANVLRLVPRTKVGTRVGTRRIALDRRG
jgi:integrase